MDIDQQLHLPTLNIHTELQLTLRTAPPETTAPIPRDWGQRRHCSAQWSSRGEGCWDRRVSKINGRGLKRDWRFGKNSNMFSSHCLIKSYLDA